MVGALINRVQINWETERAELLNTYFTCVLSKKGSSEDWLIMSGVDEQQGGTDINIVKKQVKKYLDQINVLNQWSKIKFIWECWRN